MSVTVCSGFSPKGYLEYGRNFVATFLEHWPPMVDLRVYVEEPVKGGAAFTRSLWDCRGMQSFLERHGDAPTPNGRGIAPNWKPGDRKRGYSFRYDAVKFSRQCFIPEQAARELPDGDILVWMDADVVTLKDVPEGFVESLFPEPAVDGVYLGRGRKHSEIGFWAVRLGPGTRHMLAILADWYRSDRVFGLDEQHSAYVWDICRRQAEMTYVQFHNMTPNGHDHVWFQSRLGDYMDHLKGDRKRLGASPERMNRR